MGGARLKDLKKAFYLKRASGEVLVATLEIKQVGVGVENLKKATKIRKPSKRSGRRHLEVTHKGRRIPGVFRMPLNGNAANIIFQRKPGQQKISRVFGYTALQESLKPEVVSLFQDTVDDRLPVEFNRALASQLRRLRF